MRVLALQGSPRPSGNTATLLSALLKPLSVHHTVHEFCVSGLKLAPCLSCYQCQGEDVCRQQDDMQVLYPLLATCDLVVLASPIYFYGVSAQLKSVIDRCQYFWTHPARRQSSRAGVLVLTAGAKDHNGQGVAITEAACKMFFQCLGAPLIHTLTATHTDKHPVTIESEAFLAAITRGKMLAESYK